MNSHKDKTGSFYLPPIGQRLIKTAVAVFLCLVIYILRGYQGMVVQSAIAAIICMQPYADSSKRVAVNRVISTVMGGLWGLLFLNTGIVPQPVSEDEGPENKTRKRQADLLKT